MDYIIEEIKIKDLEETLKMVEDTFIKFDAKDYTKEGIENFLKFINYKSIKNSLSKNMRMFVAKKNKKVIGVIGYRDNSHINLLFVSEKYHYNGIARNLVNLAFKKCKKIKIKTITVNSTPYAHNAYLKLGFIDKDKIQEVDGIKFYPMYMDI